MTIRLGQMALERGLITPEQLRDALADQARDVTAGRKKARQLGNILVSKGYLSPDQLVPLLEEQRTRSLPAAPPKENSAHERLGKYSLLREIGRGGMGVVYEALDTHLDRRVALKMLLTSRNADPKESALEEERFLREAKLSASLPKHPHVVSVYEAGLIDGKQVLAMEYIDGQGLSTWRKAGSVTIRQQARLLRDVALAVEHAHKHGIIHRDLKPENILIDARNEPHITDFGLAKTVGQNVSLSLTASGMIMGTPSYMSPEQAQGPKSTDHRTDIYSLGVMLYETLTGRLPFTGETAIEILMKASRSPVAPPSTVVRPGHPTLDQTIENICLKALAKNPRDRYQTAEAFAGDLTGWLKGEEVRVVPPTARRMYQPPKKRLSWALVAAGAGLVAVLALALRPGSDPAPAAPPPSKSINADFEDHLSHGRYEEAFVLAKALKDAALLDKVRWKWSTAADERFEAKKFQEAAALYDRLLKKFPEDKGALKGKEASERKVQEIGKGETVPRSPPPNPALSGEDLARHVQAELKRLNPGLDDKEIKFTVEDQQVVEASIQSGSLRDLSPVRSLTGLRVLRANGGKDPATKKAIVAPLSDLSALKGLRLKELSVTDTKVQDLSSLAGMPLSALYVISTQVRDLTPLKGMPLEEFYCSNSPIGDLSPVSNAPLRILFMNSIPVRDLEALRDLPLIKLGCSWMEISDLSPLVKMRLEYLDFEHTPVADLKPVKGMPIQTLWCGGTRVTDLSSIAGMPLRELECDFVPERDTALLRSIPTLVRINDMPVADFWRKHGNPLPGSDDPFIRGVVTLPPDEQVRRVVQKLKELNPDFDGKESHKVENGQVVFLSISAMGVRDISPVRALSSLKHFCCIGYWNQDKGEIRISDFADLSPLRGLPLRTINVQRTRVRDLSPLAGMPIYGVNCMQTDVEDLSPLKSAPLTHVECYQTRVSDLSPLKGKNLEWLNIDSTDVRDLSPISGMPLAGVLMYKTKITDFSPLKTIPHLKFLECDYNAARDREILKSIKTLEKINETPVAEFWKKQEGK